MKRMKFDNEKKLCLEVSRNVVNNKITWKKYKPYAIGELPGSFGFKYDAEEDTYGISKWIKYKGLIYIAE